MAVPTPGETFAQLIEHLRKAQDCSAMLAHLRRDDHRTVALGWLTVEQGLKEMVHHVTKLATRGLQ